MVGWMNEWKCVDGRIDRLMDGWAGGWVLWVIDWWIFSWWIIDGNIIGTLLEN